jgi:hypothetical protein
MAADQTVKEKKVYIVTYALSVASSKNCEMRGTQQWKPAVRTSEVFRRVFQY